MTRYQAINLHLYHFFFFEVYIWTSIKHDILVFPKHCGLYLAAITDIQGWMKFQKGSPPLKLEW